MRRALILLAILALAGCETVPKPKPPVAPEPPAIVYPPTTYPAPR